MPPHKHIEGAFLMGEPYSTRRCGLSGEHTSTYHAFLAKGEEFFESRQPLTEAEFGWAMEHLGVEQRIKGADPVADDCENGEDEGVKI